VWFTGDVKTPRLLCTVLVLVAMGFALGRATSSASKVPLSTPCSAPALSAHLTNVMSVQSYGCEAGWAYLWATVGTNEQDAVGVTEVLHYSTLRQGWFVVPRLTYCKPGLMPDYVYRLGCFSN
jgi:hypothetical protein